MWYSIIKIRLKCGKMLKNLDKYPLEVRYTEVRKVILKLQKSLKKNFIVEGIENLDEKQNYLFLANHQSIDDILSFISESEKPVIFISKKENEKAFILGVICRCINCFFIDRKDARQSLRILKEAAQFATSNKYNIVLFPEGTRSKDGQVHEFKSATNHLIQATKYNIAPVVLYNTTRTFKITKYKPFDVIFKILKPITFEEFLENKKDFCETTRKLLADNLAILKGANEK